MAALRTAASFAILSHCGVPKFAASPQLKPTLHQTRSLNANKDSMRVLAVFTVLS